MFNPEQAAAWGLHPMQEAFFRSLEENSPGLVPARVTGSNHELYSVLIIGALKERFAKVRGSFRHEGHDLPVVGDWVVLECLSGDHEHLPIVSVLPRVSELKRAGGEAGAQTLMANVNRIGVVTSFNQDLNFRRLERALAMIEDSRAAPFIVLNKRDLVTGEEACAVIEAIKERMPEGIPIFDCSAQTDASMDGLTQLFGRGETIALIGMSGVGKSTLVNRIVGEHRLVTQDIRMDDGRGRHTTTHRELVPAPAGYWVLDSPGIREFAFAGSQEDLDQSFSDIAALQAQCRFGNCTHQSEPGCAVRQALLQGTLAEDRWENYKKIQREAEYHENKGNKAIESEKRKEWAKRSTMLRERLKEKGRK